MSLAKIIKKYYEENSRYETGPPLRLIKGLENGHLLLADLEISDEDIAVLLRFFGNKKVLDQVKRIEINRSCGGKVNKRRNNSALNANGQKLIKELLEFVGKCTQLEVLAFDSIELEISAVQALGKALITTSSPLRWLTFRSCSLCGDRGIQELTPYLGKLQLQVLAFEYCELTDQSLPFIGSILKAQQNLLDSLFWNTTLRVDAEEQDEERVEDNKSLICSHGLVALSLLGNKFSATGLPAFSKLLRTHKWLLAINLAENDIDSDSMSVLVDQLVANQMLLAVCLRNNSGLTSSQSTSVSHSILAKWRGEQSRFMKGEARCKYLSSPLATLLKNWMRLQLEETTDLIDGRSIFSRTAHTQPRKALTGENAQDAYLLNYSVISILHGKPFASHPVLTQRYSQDYSQQQNYDISFVGQSRDGSRAGHAADRYGGWTAPPIDPVINTRSSDAEHLELLFRPSIASPVRLRRGAEYDESVDASVDKKRNHKTRNGKTAQRTARSRGEEAFDRAIGVSSPPVRGPTGGDLFEGWDYEWPAERDNRKRSDQRPPSRDSIRPHFMSSVRERGRERSRERSSSRPMSASREQQRSPSRATSPRRAWMPSSFVPQTIEELRRRAVGLGQRAISPAVVQRRKPDIPPFSKGHDAKRRLSATPKTARSKSHDGRATEKHTRRVSSAVAPKSPFMDDIASTVLAATRNLEHASQRLLNVAESLSESAFINASHISHAETAHVTPLRSVYTPIERITPPRETPIEQHVEQTPAQQMLADLESQNTQFAELVRQRMKSKLRDYLVKELQSPL